MIGLQYGTVPVVRGVGGLQNTVFDWDYDPDHPVEKRNGFVFYESDTKGVESAMGRALDLWALNRPLFEQLQRQGMEYDYSWKNPAKQYVGSYDHVRA